MTSRTDLQSMLERILGSSNVYYQSPPNTGMKYPCIVYGFAGYNRQDADNKPYVLSGKWEITHMYKSVSNDKIRDEMINVMGCAFDRRIVKDGIYNDYYNLNT